MLANTRKLCILTSILILLVPSALPAPTVRLAPVPKMQFLDNSGNPLASGTVDTFIAGTTTPQASYTDATGAVLNANPIVLDSAGRADIWLDVTLSYKFVVKNSGGTTIYTVDNVTWTAATTWSGVYRAETFSATPTFNSAIADIFAMTLTANVTSSTVSNATTGQMIAFRLCQDATGGRTFTWPTTFLRPPTIASGASACTNPTFFYDGTNWRALAASGDNTQLRIANAIRFADQFANLQAAIDDLGGAQGLIVVPSTYAGAEATSIPSNIMLLDLREGLWLTVGDTAIPARPAALAGRGLIDIRTTHAVNSNTDPLLNIIRTQSGTGVTDNFSAARFLVDNQATATGAVVHATQSQVFQRADEEAASFFGGTEWRGTTALSDPKELFGGDFVFFVDSTTFSAASGNAVEGVVNVIGANTGKRTTAFRAATAQTGNPTAAYYVAAPAPAGGNFQYGLDLKDNVFGVAAIRLRDNAIAVKRNTADTADLTVLRFPSDTITAVRGGTDVHLESGATLIAGVNATGLFVNVGVAPDGSGLKHVRTGTTCATAASVGATCDTTVTWTTAFANTSYDVSCQGNGITSGVPVDGGVPTQLAGSVTFRTVAVTAAAAQYGFIECIAVHD